MNSKHIVCPHCGQRMSHVRESVRLSPLKARMFDVIRRCPDGISSEYLMERLGLDDMALVTLRVHVWQINDRFERAGVATRIISRNSLWKIVPPGRK